MHPSTCQRQSRFTGYSHSETKTEQSGLTLSISNTVIDAANSIEQQRKAGSQTSSGRMKALAVDNAIMSTNNAIDTVTNGASGDMMDKAGGVSVNLSVGGSTSESSTTQKHSTAQGSNITAGGNINIVALSPNPSPASGESAAEGEGAGKGNITIQGSNIKAGTLGQSQDDRGNINLEATNDINLLAAKNTAEQHSSNSASSGALGVGLSSAPKGGGLSVTASASQGRGNADGSDVSWTNTHVDAGNTLTIKSGRDTNMKGAVAAGKQVSTDIGGNLNIESLQDTSDYDSQQSSRGGSLSVAIIGTGNGGSVNAADTNINSNYASVMEQSGIKAGDGGFQVKVKGNTDLKGAVLAASDEGLEKSTFKTGGTLTQSDIQNSASYNAEAEAVSAGVGSVASASAGIGSDSGNASSTTKSGIGVSTKTDTTGAIAKIFDANKVTDEVNAQVQITQTFSQLAPKAVGDYATTKLKEASDKLAAARDQNNGLTETERAQLIMDAKALDDNWGEGGAARVALHTVVGALGGGLNGAMGAGTVAVSTPEVAKIIDGMDVPEPMKQALLMATSTVIGEVAGGNAGAASGLTEVTNNYLNHTRPKPMLLSEAERYAAAKEGCAHHDDEACKVRTELAALSLSRDIEVAKACNGGASVACIDGFQAAISNGSQIKHSNDGKLLITSPEYDLFSGTGAVVRSVDDPWSESFDGQQAKNLSQSLPILAVVAAPEIVATLGTGKMVTGAILGAGFDAAGQYAQLQFQADDSYRPLQTVVAGMTGAVAFPLSGSSILGDAVLGGLSNATNTAMTNSLYDKNDSLAAAAVLGAGFSGFGAYVGGKAVNYASEYLPTNISATYIDQSIPIFQQTINLGIPNPYPNLIGAGVSNTIGAIPSFVPLPEAIGSSK